MFFNINKVQDVWLYSPLEQFDLLILNNDFFDVVNIVIYLCFILFLISVYVDIYYNNDIFFVNFLQKMIEGIYLIVTEMLVQQAGVNALKYFPYMFTVFIFVLISNLIGMLPFGFTITAHLSVTFFLAFSFNCGFLILGFLLHGFKFLYLFIPSGTPVVLLPLIIVIEVVSYLIRTFSLSIRLFANMMAGHCLLYVISSLVFSIINSFGIIAILPISLIYGAIFILEFFIAFLQSYVFVILLCIYLNDSLHPTH